MAMTNRFSPDFRGFIPRRFRPPQPPTGVPEEASIPMEGGLPSEAGASPEAPGNFTMDTFRTREGNRGLGHEGAEAMREARGIGQFRPDRAASPLAGMLETQSPEEEDVNRTRRIPQKMRY